MAATSPIRASVVVVTYNHREVVPRCLEALRPTLGPADEVLVVDNSSTDGTPERVAAEFPWVRLVRSGGNPGFGAACNLGAAAARGQYLVFLNPDTVPRAGWLEALLRGLSAPGVGLATAKLLLARAPERVDAFGNAVHLSGITTSRGWDEPSERHAALAEVSAVSGGCFVIARALFERLDGFDARYFLYYEDTDLSLRARLAGYTCVAVPDAEVLHDHQPGFSPAKLRYLERNRWWTLLKLYRWQTLAALLPVLVLGEALAWGMAVRSGPRHMLAKAAAWVDLLGWLRDLPTARTAAAHTRELGDVQLLRLHETRLPFGQVANGPAGRGAEQVVGVISGGGRALAAALGAR